MWVSVIWYIHLFSFCGVNDLLPCLCMFSLLHQKGSNENKQNHLNLQVTAQFWLHMTNFSLDTVLTKMLLCLFSFLTSLRFFLTPYTSQHCLCCSSRPHVQDKYSKQAWKLKPLRKSLYPACFLMASSSSDMFQNEVWLYRNQWENNLLWPMTSINNFVINLCEFKSYRM